MKIAFLHDSISRRSGGLLESARGLARAIAEDDEVTVFGVADEFTDVDLASWLPLQPKIFPRVGPHSLGYAPGYLQALAAAEPDIAHVHGLWTYHSLVAYRWYRRTKRPLVYTVHGMLDAWAVRNSAWKKRLVGALWENAAHRSAACIHVLSEAEYRSVREYGLRNPVCIIPNGINLPEEKTKEKVETRMLLYLGRLHPKKNLAALIRAFAQNRKSEIGNRDSRKWVLAIAGWDQGGYRMELERLKDEVEIGDSVVFMGPKFGAEKDEVYRACDAFVLPSLSEGLPMSILEAWAYAKPVLMTPECNLPEGFEANAAIRIGTSAESISVGLQRLFQMDDLRLREKGERGFALVRDRFSWPDIGQQMRAVYQWVIGGGPSPATVRFD